MNDSDFFKGKIAIVTGAASGIGKALTLELLGKGAVVYPVDIDEVGLKTIDHQNAYPRVCDVTNYSIMKASIESILEEYGKIDLLFNVAGIGYAGEMEGYSMEAWKKIVDINLFGVVNTVQLIYPHMKKQGSGRIINMASIAGLVPSGLLVPYATTKYAVVGLSKSLRLEAELNNINIHLVYPGTIHTQMLNNASPTDMPESSRINAARYLQGITGDAKSSDELSKYILRKIVNNELDIYYPSKVKEIWWLNRYFPKYLKKLAIKSVKTELNNRDEYG